MEKKIVLKKLTLITSLLAPFIASAADKREVVTLSLPHDATVADVICSEVNGHIGFNVPLAPHFTKRGIFRSFPKGMSEYPAYFSVEKGRLTTAAMIRFIEQSPELFTNKQEKAAYKKSLTAAIEAHKAWYSTKSEEKLVALRIAENDVFNQLKKLSLSMPFVQEKVEKILSSPQQNILSRIARSLILPGRAYVAKNKHEEIVSKKNHAISIFVKQIIIAWSALPLGKALNKYVITPYHKRIFNSTEKALGVNPMDEPTIWRQLVVAQNNNCMRLGLAIAIWIVFLKSTAFALAFTDFKLAPEPENGINVQIQVGA